MTPQDPGAGQAPDGAPAPDPAAAPELREITDVRTLRALAHPVRIALIEELTINGPMTATEAAEGIGESPTTCSFHLRQLAKYGFVEEAGGGKGRSRPWKMTSVGMSLTSSPEDPEVQLATNAVAHMFRERQFARYQAWLEARHAFPPAWREAAPDSQILFYLTAEELAQLSEELDRLLLPRFMDRITDPGRRPAGSVPVEMMVLAYPIRLPAAGDSDKGAGGAGDGSEGAAS
ncbi:MAG TPA: helix-turn-helix domain-containing protein [Streptosporangiaceae bacterium]|nr:helix-turn-helix domain-containing protein [Streptosporangiaceae bacterium]